MHVTTVTEVVFLLGLQGVDEYVTWNSERPIDAQKHHESRLSV